MPRSIVDFLAEIDHARNGSLINDFNHPEGKEEIPAASITGTV